MMLMEGPFHHHLATPLPWEKVLLTKRQSHLVQSGQHGKVLLIQQLPHKQEPSYMEQHLLPVLPEPLGSGRKALLIRKLPCEGELFSAEQRLLPRQHGGANWYKLVPVSHAARALKQWW